MHVWNPWLLVGPGVLHAVFLSSMEKPPLRKVRVGGFFEPVKNMDDD
jgi:hypothetical protein